MSLENDNLREQSRKKSSIVTRNTNNDRCSGTSINMDDLSNLSTVSPSPNDTQILKSFVEVMNIIYKDQLQIKNWNTLVQYLEFNSRKVAEECTKITNDLEQGVVSSTHENHKDGNRPPTILSKIAENQSDFGGIKQEYCKS